MKPRNLLLLALRLAKVQPLHLNRPPAPLSAADAVCRSLLAPGLALAIAVSNPGCAPAAELSTPLPLVLTAADGSNLADVEVARRQAKVEAARAALEQTAAEATAAAQRLAASNEAGRAALKVAEETRAAFTDGGGSLARALAGKVAPAIKAAVLNAADEVEFALEGSADFVAASAEARAAQEKLREAVAQLSDPVALESSLEAALTEASALAGQLPDSEEARKAGRPLPRSRLSSDDLASPRLTSLPHRACSGGGAPAARGGAAGLRVGGDAGCGPGRVPSG